MSTVNIVSKISVKKILGSKPKVPTEKTMLMQVYGIATGVETGESNYGPWTALAGSFRAVDLVNGIIYQSGKCFLPKMGIDLVAPLITKSGVQGLEFALNIGVVPSEQSVTGYEYFVEPILEAAENDPLEALSKKVNAALPAPKADKKKG